MLFDNNDGNGFDYTILDLMGINNMNNNGMNMNNNTNTSNLNLYSSKEGFLRGNMFKDLYMPYKNLTFVNISPKSDREAKLYTIMQYEFAINDLNLYLDLHPNDTSVVSLFKNLVKESKKTIKEYEREYGPLAVCDVESNTFDWIEEPWSWDKENGGGMYV